LDIPILAELPLVPGVSEGGDGGAPYALTSKVEGDRGGEEWRAGMKNAAQRVLDSIRITQETK
jgi:ATP-binding protein involved in chromosome partitioning